MISIKDINKIKQTNLDKNKIKEINVEQWFEIVVRLATFTAERQSCTILVNRTLL